MNLLFFIFSSLALVSGLMVIQSKNPIHSVLFLILVFFNSAGLLVLLGLDFMAFIFLIVYVGAIAVLFLFVIMMLSIKLAEINEKRLRYLPINAILGLLFLIEISLILDTDLISLISFGSVFTMDPENSNLYAKSLENTSLDFSLTSLFKQSYDLTVISLFENQIDALKFNEWSQLFSRSSNIESIGLSLYTYYFVFFLLASFILLVAMIGAIMLTMSKQVSIKRQKVFQQNTRSFSETVSRFT